MRYVRPLLNFSFAVALCAVLGGCGSTSGWDPTEMLNFLDMKKRAPGERRPVFPEGVPGVAQGVPKEMVRGSPEAQAQAAAEANAAAAAAATAPAEPPPPKRAAKQKQATKRAPAPVEVAPDDVNVEDQPPPRR